jgi:hypothetical protein
MKQHRFVKVSATGEILRPKAAEWAAVFDKQYGLMWQVNEPRPLTLSEAIFHCRCLRLAGVNAWRIPNSLELNSIVDRACIEPAIRRDFFPLCEGGWYWALSRRDGAAMVVNFGKKLYMDNTLPAPAANRYHVRAVCIHRPDEAFRRVA